MDSWLQDEIDYISEYMLSGKNKNDFLKCVQDIKYGKYESLRDYDDALSAVMQIDKCCNNCIKNIKDKEKRNRIKDCLSNLIKDS